MLTLTTLLFGACDDAEPAGAGGSTAAVDHVSSVLADAGHAPAGLTDAVVIQCGPADEVLGRHLREDPIEVDVAFADLVPLVAEVGREVADPPEDPTAGAPSHIDRHETGGEGWTVRWGESLATHTDAGEPATTVTFVDAGPVSADDLRRWEQDGTVVMQFRCG